MSAYREQVTATVCQEMDRQAKKWGEDRGKPARVLILVLIEEVGEVARAVLEGKDGDLYKELIQVAAVASSWAEGLLDEMQYSEGSRPARKEAEHGKSQEA